MSDTAGEFVGMLGTGRWSGCRGRSALCERPLGPSATLAMPAFSAHPARFGEFASNISNERPYRDLVFHRDADPPWTKPVADSAGWRRRGWRFPWCERARVLVGSGAPEAPPIAPWVGRPGSSVFRLSSRVALRRRHIGWREL